MLFASVCGSAVGIPSSCGPKAPSMSPSIPRGHPRRSSSPPGACRRSDSRDLGVIGEAMIALRLRALAFLGALISLAVAHPAAAAPVGFGQPVFVDQTLAG